MIVQLLLKVFALGYRLLESRPAKDMARRDWGLRRLFLFTADEASTQCSQVAEER
jgi:hypothetical protein